MMLFLVYIICILALGILVYGAYYWVNIIRETIEEYKYRKKAKEITTIFETFKDVLEDYQRRYGYF